MNKSFRTQIRGTTLPETIIGLFLLVTFFASVFELNAVCLRYIDATKESVAALQHVQDRAEMLRNLAFKDLTDVTAVVGKGHVHFHYPHEHLHEHDHEHDHEEEHHYQARPTSDRAAIASLLAFLTFSPCEGFVPFYFSGIRYGWAGFAVLTAVLSIATVAGMVIFTSLTLAGLSKIKLGILERYESALMGTLLCAVGVFIILFET